jgi:TonB family protein
MLITNKKNQIFFLLSFAMHVISASLIFFLSTDLRSYSENITAVDFILTKEKNQTLQKNNQIQKTQTTQLQSSRPVSKSEPKAALSESSNPNSDKVNIENGVLAKNAEQIYTAELKKFIESKKKYPMIAKKMGQSGRVIIQFELNSNGHVISKKLITMSDYQILNDSTLHLIDSMGQFKKFPDQIKKTSWQFVLPVDYKL